MFSQIVETDGSTTVDQFCYRGDGVANNQGGADVDGTNADGVHAFVILELNSSAEVFKSSNASASAQSLATANSRVVMNAATTEVEADPGSFTKFDNTEYTVNATTDVLLGKNISGAYATVSSTARATIYSRFTINGVEQAVGQAGDYGRGNQGSIDTFGWSSNGISFHAVSDGDEVGVNAGKIAGGEGGTVAVQPGWLGFWGVNLDTLEDAGGTDALLADDVESASEVTSPGLSGPARGEISWVELQYTASSAVALLADDVESASEISATALEQEHALLADDPESASEVSAPAISQEHDLLANDVEAASETSAPAIGQAHQILANDVESASEASIPTLGQDHDLSADNVEAAPEVSVPALTAVSGTDNLLADDVQSASEVATPAIGQEYSLSANDAPARSEVTTPTIGQEHALSAANAEGATDVTTPDLTPVSGAADLSAEDVESSSEATSPNIGQVHILEAFSTESASQFSLPAIGQADNLNADSVASASGITQPSIGQIHAAGTAGAEAQSAVSTPALESQRRDLAAYVHRVAYAPISTRVATVVAARGRICRPVQARRFAQVRHQLRRAAVASQARAAAVTGLTTRKISGT